MPNHDMKTTAQDWSEPDFKQVLGEAVELIAGRSFSDAATRLDHALRGAKARGKVEGPMTCELLFHLGICRYETGELEAAEKSFLAGVDMARLLNDHERVGIFLHELSLVSQQRGDHVAALWRARDSLVAKLCHHVTVATHVSRFAKPLRRREPVESIVRFAWLLLTLRQWQEAELIYRFALDSYAARNDLDGLAKSLIALAAITAQRDTGATSKQEVISAVNAADMAGLDIDWLLASAGFSIPPAAAGESRVQFDMRDRQDLERALIKQYREIAQGLLADRLLREGDIPERAWWHQFCSLRHPPSTPAENYDDEDFVAFKNEMFVAVAERRIRRIGLTELAARKITIKGVQLFCWQEGTINRQLAEAGSSLRLFMVGCDVARADELLSILQEPASEPIVPSHFILGEVNPMSAIGRANLFDFTREYAASPYLNPDSAGMHDSGRVALRQVIIGHMAAFRDDKLEMLYEATGLLEAGAGPTREELISNYVLANELGEFMVKFPQGSANFPSWLAIVRDDLCRFAQTPRTLAEIQMTFCRAFEGLGAGVHALHIALFPAGESPVDQPLAKILYELRQEGLILIDDTGCWHCPAYHSD